METHVCVFVCLESTPAVQSDKRLLPNPSSPGEGESSTNLRLLVETQGGLVWRWVILGEGYRDGKHHAVPVASQHTRGPPGREG